MEAGLPETHFMSHKVPDMSKAAFGRAKLND